MLEIAIVLALLGTSFMFVYIAMNLDRKEHGSLQVFFLFIGIINIFILFGVILEFTKSMESIYSLILSGFSVTIWTFIILILYFIVMFGKNIIKELIGKDHVPFRKKVKKK